MIFGWSRASLRNLGVSQTTALTKRRPPLLSRPPFADCDPHRLEEDPDPELDVTWIGRRTVASQCPEVRIVRLPDTVELVRVQRPDVERERVARGESRR